MKHLINGRWMFCVDIALFKKAVKKAIFMLLLISIGIVIGIAM